MDIKVIKQKFKSSIRRGTGEAYLIIESYPQIDFSDEIIKASFKNYAYDAQSEGNRAMYIAELIFLSGKQEKIRNAVLKRLASEQVDTWAVSQLLDLAVIFAKTGDAEMRETIYTWFYAKPISDAAWLGQDAVIELDGLEGLKMAAEAAGKDIEEDIYTTWLFTLRIDSFQKKNPTIKVYKELEKAAKKSEGIWILLDRIKKDKLEKRPKHKRDINYEFITEKINRNAPIHLSRSKAEQISPHDLKKLANDFLRETDRDKLSKYLRIFNNVKFPYNYQPILALAKSKNAKNDRFVEFACGALRYFSGADVREFAVQKLGKAKHPSNYLHLLVSNYKKGDSKLLTQIAERCKNEHTVHNIVWGYIDIYTANKTKECKRPLEAIYEKLTCGLHRYDIVKLLVDSSVLSKKIRKEIKHDSDEETRKLVA